MTFQSIVAILLLLVVNVRAQVPFDDETIRIAVDLWYEDRDAAEAQYGPIGDWDTSQVTSFRTLFYRGDRENTTNTFNEFIGLWDTSSVTTMRSMFFNATEFNQDLSLWNTSNVNSTRLMFSGATSFNGALNGWDTSKVENFEGMFSRCVSFNQPLNSFDTSSATNMARMFFESAFNQPLDNFNTSLVTEFGHMFENTTFNQPLDNFDTGMARDMTHMFRFNPAFNQQLNWQTGTVIGMQEMFRDATSFSQSLCWNLTGIFGMFDADTARMFCGSQGSFDPACDDIAPLEFREAALDCDTEVPTVSPAPTPSESEPTLVPTVIDPSAPTTAPTLVPSVSEPTTLAPTTAPGMESIVEILSSDSRFTIVLDLVNATGLLPVLEGVTEGTIFAPTNDAFMILGLPPDAPLEEIESILLYHAANGNIGLEDGKVITTSNGADVVLTVTSIETKVNDANIEETLPASNGVVYVIDMVLIPPSDPTSAPVDVTAAPVAQPTSAPSPADSCVQSGGVVSTAMCCESSLDFPNNCVIGACGCAPEFSKDTQVCICPEDSCFDGTECVPIESPTSVPTSLPTESPGSEPTNTPVATPTSSPVSEPTTQAPTTAPGTETIAEIFASDSRLTIAYDLSDATGLLAGLNGTDPLTIFAPTDDAFEVLDLPPDTDVAEIESLLLYHAAEGNIGLEDGKVITTLNGADIVLTVTATETKVNDANIEDTLPASNGVVYVIDMVLIPPTLTPTSLPTESPGAEPTNAPESTPTSSPVAPVSVPTDPPAPTVSPPPTVLPVPTDAPRGKVCPFCPGGRKPKTHPKKHIFTTKSGIRMTCGLLHKTMFVMDEDDVETGKCSALQNQAKRYCCGPPSCPFCVGGTKPTTHPHKPIYKTEYGHYMTCGELHKKASSLNKHGVQSGKCANVQKLAARYCCRAPHHSKGSKSKSAKGPKGGKSSKHAHKHAYKHAHNVKRWYEKTPKGAKRNKHVEARFWGW